ncbi:MAG: hypothetical protein R3B70_21650 [Polyangiaceae bacterium]
MESERWSVKLPIAAPCPVERDRFVLFFHRLIQDASLPELTVDVTDYSHVPNGPGVMLICHEAHYSLDTSGAGLGLKCATRRGAQGDTKARIERALRKALTLASLMETHEVLAGQVRFDTRTALFAVEDRLAAPSTQATFNSIAPIVATVAERAWGAPPVLSLASTEKECFQIELTSPVGPSVTELLSRI